LVDVRERHYRTYRWAVASIGGRPLGGTAYWRLKRRGTPQAEVLTRSGVDAERRDEYLERFLERIEAPASLALDQLFPGAVAALAALQRRGARLVLHSLRRSPDAFARQVDRLGIGPAFELVDSGRVHRDGAMAKRHLIERAGFEAVAAVVGDTEADILAARALGLASVGVTTGLRNRGFLLGAGAGTVVDRIGQVPAILDASYLACWVRSPRVAATQAASSAMPSSRATSGR
jgi:phosphoglycolate phosphatase